VRIPKLLLSLTLIFVFLAGCNGPGPGGDWISYSYSLEVFTENETTQYRLYFPVPVNETNEIDPDFINNVDVFRGTFNFEINETQFGPVLEINGTGDMEINFVFAEDGEGEFAEIADLSLLIEHREAEELGFFWIYSDSDNISFRLRYNYDHSNGGWEWRNYEMLTTVHEGWQQVPGTVIIENEVF
jgi:hypothetical protein